MTENWKAIPNYEGYYEVSDLGMVKSVAHIIMRSNGKKQTIKERILRPATTRQGYQNVVLTVDSKKESINIHSLVMLAFKGHKPNRKTVVDHIDNDPKNNKITNLQLISQRHNASKEIRGSSRYVGVSWDSSRNLWASSIRIEGKSKYLGRFNDEYDAHIAYQSKLKEITV